MTGESHTWQGKWCSTRKHLTRPWNTYLYFRKTLDLPAKPRRAIVRISADARYTLYVNARRVHFGPARCYPDQQAYDILDLASYLEPGPNVLAVIVHQFGVPTFQAVYRATTGLIVDGSAECDAESIPFHTPAGWLARPATAWRKNVARLSAQLGFQEHFDADAESVGWMLPTYVASPETGWRDPYVQGPAGRHPWIALAPRDVPLLAQHVENFTAVLAQFHGENARGYKIVEDVYHLAMPEKRRREKAILENPTAMFRDDDALTVVPAPADGEFVMAVLDPGAYRTGHIILDIADAAGDEIIDVLYTEALDKTDAPKFIEPNEACEESTATRYRCRPGAQRWESFHFYGTRYVTLIFRNLEKPLKIRYVGLRQVHADLAPVGAFQCSDDTLNAVHAAGVRTQLNCLFDAFVDCPWREQAMWWGDARVQAGVTAYTFGDYSLLARGIRLMAQSQSADGSLQCHPPSDISHNRLPDFMLTWVGSLWDYHFHTARTELLRECLPALHRLMEFFHKHEVADHLIGGFEGMWVFLDWQSLYKSNLSGVLNLMYLQALRWAAAICEVAQDADGADRYLLRAQSVQNAIVERFWSPQDKLWRDGFDLQTRQQVDEVSQQMNALAILLDLKPETHLKLARDLLVKPALGKRTKVLTGSPFFYAYILDAIAEAGLREEIPGIIREKWGAMLASGSDTFWEFWTPTGSLCHAWSASPVYHLAQQVLGVRPVEIGWRRISITPLPLNLEYARGVVASPHGPIRVDWEKAGEDQLVVHVEIPHGIEAEFTDPLGKTRVLGAGTHEFQT